MEWLAANWFWVLTFIAFVAMHMFGHSGHGGHGGGARRSGKDDKTTDDVQGRGVNTSSTGHQH